MCLWAQLQLGRSGALLIIPGLLLGGTLPQVTLLGFFYLLMLIGIQPSTYPLQ